MRIGNILRYVVIYLLIGCMVTCGFLTKISWRFWRNAGCRSPRKV